MLTLAAHLLDTSLSLVSNASVKGLKTNQTVFHWAVFEFLNSKMGSILIGEKRARFTQSVRCALSC